MKIGFSKYKEQFGEMPEPLQKQVLIRLGFALAFLLLFILVLCVITDWLTVVPFICLSIYSVASAFLLLRRVAAGGYVVIRGRCIEAVETMIRKRTKSILVETDEHLVRVILRQRFKRIRSGTELEIFVADNAQVYEKDGAQLLGTYITINTIGGERNDKSKRLVSETENP